MGFSKTIFCLAIAAAMFLLGPATVEAEEKVGCQEDMPLELNSAPAGYDDSYYENFESIEYINGYLAIHFRLNRPLAENDRIQNFFTLVSESCSQRIANNVTYAYGAEIPFGSRNFSIRFSSANHYQIYDDDSNTPLNCEHCIQDLDLFGDFFQVRLFSFVILYGTNTHIGEITSSNHHIKERPNPPPVFENKVSAPPGCGDIRVFNGIVDPVQKTEYVDGLLRMHFHRDPFLAGQTGPFYFKVLTYDKDCNEFPRTPEFGYRSFSVNFSTPIAYFSARFTSPTHFVLWNDDLDIPAKCSGYSHCEADVEDDPNPLVAYIGVGGERTIRSRILQSFYSTPFTIEKRHPSVIFIPGFEASRLYRQDDFFENQLWEPNRHQDVQDLYLDANGNSIRADIYKGDIIDKINLLPAGQGNIYKSFKEMMNGLVADDTIAEWKAIPYDWRFDNDTVIASTGMVAEVERMASASNTGKVTLVAHSNGGLVAKSLIAKLEERGKAGLVDKLILVAVPQMGTPKALEALLHGTTMSFLKRMFVPRWIARGLAEHMQSAFNLLPTESYFEKVIDPVVEFDTSAISTKHFREVYGDSITTADKMRSFLAGMDGRVKPAPRDVISPNVLLSSFINRSVTSTNEQDSWVAPVDLEVIQISGWGLNTLRGIKYTDRTKNVCNENLSICLPQKVLDERPLVTTDGDKTVISYSADKIGGERYYVDLKEYNRLSHLTVNRDHADILEIPDLLNGLKAIIQGSTPTTTRYLLTSKPVDPVTSRRLSVHSPSTIDVYDENSKHTGLISNPDSESDIQLVEEQIPNSSYYEFGEGKYISVPAEGQYSIVLKGTDAGTFTLESESGLNGEYQGGPVYIDIPVDQNTVAAVDIDSNGAIGSLEIDLDGDGTTDSTVEEGEEISPEALLDVLEYRIERLNLNNFAKQLNKEIKKTRKAIADHKINKANASLNIMLLRLRKAVKQHIVMAEQAGNLVQLINQIKESM